MFLLMSSMYRGKKCVKKIDKESSMIGAHEGERGAARGKYKHMRPQPQSLREFSLPIRFLIATMRPSLFLEPFFWGGGKGGG